MAIVIISSGDSLLNKYVFDTVSLYINIWYVYHFWKRAYICSTPPSDFHVILILSAWQPLKCMVISSMEKVTPSIKMSGNINCIYMRICCTLQFGDFVLGRFLVRVLRQAKNYLKGYCDRIFHLDQNNCRWNHFHVTFPHDVSWI